MRTAGLALLVVLAACVDARAGDLLVLSIETEAVIVDTATDAVTSVDHSVAFSQTNDAVIDEAGTVYTSHGDQVFFWNDAAAQQVLVDVVPEKSFDVAFFSDGSLAVGTSAISDAMFRVNPAGNILERIAAPPGLGFEGMTVPRSGPAEDEILALLIEKTIFASDYYLVRYRRDALGRFAADAPIPLAFALSDPQCVLLGLGGPVRAPIARADGESFLVTDGCVSQVKEFALDGTYLGVFASAPPDLTVPLRSRPHDALQNLLVMPDDSVYVLTSRRLRHHDAEGNLLGIIDHIFQGSTALALLDWVPFEGGTGTCDPASLGYWKRQCLGWDSGMRGPRRDRRSDLAPLPSGASRPGIHPSLRLAGIDELFAAADRRMAAYGLTTCQALWPEDQSDPRARALMHLAPAMLNRAAKHLRLNCEVNVDGAIIEVRDLLALIDTLLAENTDESNREAARLAHRIHTATEGR